VSAVGDDRFREIQLNGKQLVFVFMAATVVSVVIFLCGVLVGRGVRAERTLAAAQADALAEPTADHPAPWPTSIQTTADVSKVEAPPVADEAGPPNRLERNAHPVEEIRPDPPKAPAAAATTKAAPTRTAAAPAAATTPPAAKPAPPAKDNTPSQPNDPTPAVGTAPPAGSGYAVQVAAVPARSEADAIAKRLASKGYSTYVQMPSGGANGVFRVRVGTFKTRHEAETVAARLEKEEQIKPWVTR